MSFYGKLSTMSLPDLLQWASANRKTGILELERNKICRRITFRDGKIVACSSDDPPALLGQFLLSRGKISRENLREALARQAATGENLGSIIQDMGLLNRAEVESQVAAKAEENIYGLFDWADAVFRFLEKAPTDRHTIEVNLSVEDILIRGAQRQDELQRVRNVFRNSGIVLRRTDRPAPTEIKGSPMARRIVESINGERTLAEILLHAHASEFLVIKFLFMLHGRGIVEIAGERPIDPQTTTLLDAVRIAADVPPSVSEEAPEEGPKEPEREEEILDAAGETERAVELMSRKEYAAALDVLNRCYRAQPDDNHLRHLLFQAESGYLETVRKGVLAPSKIPVLLPAARSAADSGLQPTELFLLDMLDGKTDIQSISWVAPLREVDLLRALQRMLDRGLIELRDPEPDAEARRADAPVKAVQWSPF